MTPKQPLLHNPTTPVIAADDIVTIDRHRETWIEVVGQVTDIHEDQTKNGDPYAFINFGDWRRNCFCLVLWSEALDAFARDGIKPPDLLRQWVSVRGVVEIFKNGRVQIVPDRPDQITIFDNEQQARHYLASASCLSAPVTPQPTAPQLPPSTSVKTRNIAPVTTAHGDAFRAAGRAPAIVPALPTVAVCAFCAQPLRPQAKVCGNCGVPLHPPTRLRPGELLNGRYTIKRALSRGGMGEIYLATDGNIFGRQVVVKVMLDYFDPNDTSEVRAAQQMFEHEARTLAELNHQAIPKIYDFFRVKADAYIVMEYIAGHNLEQQLSHSDMADRHIAGQAYPREQVIRYGIELCGVLQYLAGIEQGPIIHHDIKPANLLLDPNGIVRLVDFGTARPHYSSTCSDDPERAHGYGTSGYAPPEQYRGETESRSDVYALAATLYHLATDDDPRDHPLSFPMLPDLGDLGQILTQALARDIASRPSAGELEVALRKLIADTEETRSAAAEVQRRVAEAEQRRLQAEAEIRRQQQEIEQQRLRIEADAQRQQQEIERQRRSAQVEVRHQQQEIERIQREYAMRHTPDGTLIREIRDLVAWCEQNWRQAAAWLYDGKRFAQQVAYLWGQTFENGILSIVRRYPNHQNAGLDAVLAYLDPQDYGSETPKLSVDSTKKELDFGVLSLTTERCIVVMVKNTGRRYIESLSIEAPSWIQLTGAGVTLLPGEERALTFLASGRDTKRQDSSARNIKVLVNGLPVGILSIKVRRPHESWLARLKRFLPWYSGRSTTSKRVT